MVRQQARREKKKTRRAELRRQYGWLTPGLLIAELARARGIYTWIHQRTLRSLGGKQRVDIFGYCDSDRNCVVVEIEGGQDRPISNVAKVWRHSEHGSFDRPVIMVQLFSPSYAEGEGIRNTRMKESIFIGEQMNKYSDKVRYFALGPEHFPEGEERVAELAEKILRLVPAVTNDAQ